MAGFRIGLWAKRRRGVVVGAAVLFALATVVAACSSEQPPAAGSNTGLDGGSSFTQRPPDSGTIVSGDAGQIDADGGDAGDGGTCLGDSPSLDGGAATCPESGPCSEPCGRVLTHYRVGVAEAAVACIVALPSCEIAADVIPCVDQALSRACPEATAATYCAPLVSACDPNAGDAGSMISHAGCELFANGFSSAGRAAFKACVDDKIALSTCPAEVGACADEIRQ